MKKILVFLVSLFCFGSVSAQSISYEELEQMIIGLNSMMPLGMGSSMELTSASLSPTELTIEASINDIGGTMGNLTAEDIRTIATGMISSNAEMKNLCKILVDLNLGLHYVFNGEVSGNRIAVTFSVADLSTICNTETTPYQALEIFVNQQKSVLPMKLGEQMSMTDAYLTSSTLEMVIEADDMLVDALYIDAAHDAMATMVSQDMATLQMAVVCVNAGYGFSYVYRGKTSGIEKRIIMTVTELKNAISQSEYK